MAALSRVAAQGPAAAFPGGRLIAGGDTGEGARTGGEERRACATSYWHVP